MPSLHCFYRRIVVILSTSLLQCQLTGEGCIYIYRLHFNYCASMGFLCFGLAYTCHLMIVLEPLDNCIQIIGVTVYINRVGISQPSQHVSETDVSSYDVSTSSSMTVQEQEWWLQIMVLLLTLFGIAVITVVYARCFMTWSIHAEVPWDKRISSPVYFCFLGCTLCKKK